MSIYLGDKLIRDDTGLEKVYSIEKEFTVDETHVVTGYEAAIFDFISLTDETSQIYNSENIYAWIFNTKHKTEDIEYNCSICSSGGICNAGSYISKINDSISTTNPIRIELRNDYGILFRVMLNKNTTAYQGDYITSCTVYKINV